MAVDVIMPHMGESVVEGTILAWLKNPGDTVAEDEPLVEIETDKITVEVPSPAAGVLLAVYAEVGGTVAIEGKIALIGEAGEAAAQGAPAKPPAAEEKKEPQPAPAPEPRESAPPAPVERKEAPAPPAAPAPSALREAVPPSPAKPAIQPTTGPVAPGKLGVLASPAVRRLARQLEVDLANVTGTGRMGRLSKEDVTAFAERRRSEAEPSTEGPAQEPVEAGDDEELVPLTPMRRAIADHMVRSKREAPHVTTVAEVDITEVAELREARREEYAAEGVRLTYMAFILSAVARALKDHPELNASWTANGILVKYRINLGLAVALEEGLVVPVIRDADRLSLLELARAVQTIAEKTRAGKVAPSDVTGGTFTITNPGVFGAVISTPIIHQPQAAILATGRIADVPAVVNNGITVRKRMFLSLSYDHRIVDGATAVRFLQRVRQILEEADFQDPSS